MADDQNHYDDEADIPEEEPTPPPHGRVAPEAPEIEGGILEEEIPSPAPHGQIPPGECECPECAEHEHEAAPTSLADLSVYDMLRFTVGMLNQAAWVHLGLVVAPGSTEPKPDLPQARVAIDTLEALAKQLQPDANEEEKRELTNLLDTLRLNYVRKVG
ncbi:MAG TPA: DUF1844 domain-containing protein [Armatimonadota bacterium]|jgi:hypothetical protein